MKNLGIQVDCTPLEVLLAQEALPLAPPAVRGQHDLFRPLTPLLRVPVRQVRLVPPPPFDVCAERLPSVRGSSTRCRLSPTSNDVS